MRRIIRCKGPHHLTGCISADKVRCLVCGRTIPDSDFAPRPRFATCRMHEDPKHSLRSWGRPCRGRQEPEAANWYSAKLGQRKNWCPNENDQCSTEGSPGVRRAGCTSAAGGRSRERQIGAVRSAAKVTIGATTRTNNCFLTSPGGDVGR